MAGTAYAASGGGLTLYFEQTAFFAGTTTFQYTATDSGGADSPGAATVTIDVAPVADPPVIASVAQAEFSPADPSPNAGRSVREEAALPTWRGQFTLLEIISNIR